MSYNGSGTYVPPAGQPVATGTVIQSATFNTLVTDIGNTFNNVLPRDGQASMAGQLKITDGTSSVPGIAFNSEASTGIFRPVQGTLALSASGVESLRVNNAGRVLIGTTADDGSNTLQINGSAKVSGAATMSSTLNVTGATSLSTLNTLGAATIGSTLAIIGNTTVGGALTVTGTGSFGNTVAINAGNDVGFALNGGLALQRKTGDALGFVTASLERMRIMAAGNVLIGTTTDDGTTKLQVAGSAQVTGLTVMLPSTSSGAVQSVNVFSNSDAGNNEVRLNLDPISGNTAAQGAYIGAIRNGANYNSSLTLGVASAEAARIDVNGNLLVGTTGTLGKITSFSNTNKPAYAATGKNASNVSPDISISRSSSATAVGTGPCIQFDDSTSSNYSKMIQNGLGNLSFWGIVNGGWTEQMRVNSSGRLLINTTTDGGAMLSVGGGIQASAAATSHSQGSWLEWNKDNGGGATYLLNQKGGGPGGIVFGEVDTANYVTERMRINSVGNVLIGHAVDDGTGAQLQAASASIGTIVKPTIKGYLEQGQVLGANGALTINPDNGTMLEIALNGNSTITLPASYAGLSYTVIVYYNGAYSLSFAGGTSIRWAGGSAPQPTSQNGRMDKYVFTCGPGGWYTMGQDGGRNF